MRGFLFLAQAVIKKKEFDTIEAYGGQTKEKIRGNLAYTMGAFAQRAVLGRFGAFSLR